VPAALFHIVPRLAWERARVSGAYAPDSLQTEGFVHCSFADQVVAVAERLYRDVPDLIVVELDPARIQAPVVVEDSYGSGEAFPHVYGPLPIAAEQGTRPLRLVFEQAERAGG
jgi:uncharacterized protein (DUF952 family)